MPKYNTKPCIFYSFTLLPVLALIASGFYGFYTYFGNNSRVLGTTSVTYFVDKDSIGGACSDSNLGTPLDKPLCSVTKANTLAGPGTTIYFRKGLYPSFTITKSGNSSTYLTYSSYNNEKVIVSGSTDGIFISGASYVKLSGFEVVGAKGSGAAGIRVAALNGVTPTYNIIENNLVHDNVGTNTNGIKIENGSYNKILNNEVYSNYLDGIKVITYDGIVTTGNEIAGNKSYNNILAGGNANGILIIGVGTKNTTIKSNITYGNADDGIDTWETSGNIVIGNIAHDHKGSGDGNGFKLGGASTGGNNFISQNIAYNNKQNGFDSNGSGGNLYYNNVAYNNTGFGFEDGWKDSSCTVSSCKTTYVNNIGYNNARANFNASDFTSISHNNIWFSDGGSAKASYNYSSYDTLASFYSATKNRLDNPNNGNLSSLSINPGFKNMSSSDFSLVTGSGAIDKGDISNPGKVLSNGIPDIGAIEYGSGTTVVVLPPVADSTLPVVKITTPLTGSKLRSTTAITIKATAIDNVSVSKVVFSVNGYVLCQSYTSPYQCKWTPGIKGMQYIIEATATDSSGNSASSQVSVNTR